MGEERNHAGEYGPQPTGAPGYPLDPRNVLRRSVIACNRCRSRKTKCAGRHPYPCVACQAAGSQCVYSESEKRVTVPESYILDLQAQVRRRRSGRPVQDDAPEPSDTSLADVQWGNTRAENWVVGQSGQYHYMGNSSSAYIANRLNPTTETVAWHLYPHYEDTSWLRRPLDVGADEMPPLPPYELAKRLYRAQHGYIGTIFSFLREDDFFQRLSRVYARPRPNPADKEECLVYCQILLVLAFGQMYSINQWVGDDGPPGFTFFKHALKFLPNMHEDGSILFVEVLSYVAYYVQTLNRRDAAYLYIGIALRMSLSLGLHQEVSDQEIDRPAREHRRRVWWSVYSIERILSVTSGHPVSIQDEDVDLQPPSPIGSESPRISCVLNSYSQLSRIQGIIGEQIYRKKRSSGTSLSASVLDIMKSLSDWYRKLPEDVRLDISDMNATLSRESVSLSLHYYHCINMTARPLLLYAVQKQMAVNAQRHAGARWEDGLSPEIVGVIDSAISAARSSAMIFHTAAKFNLVATYGFIDGEQAFSAALLLVMVNIAFPYNEPDAKSMETALLVLQGMAERGNKYIQACHSLLSKINTIGRPSNPLSGSIGNSQGGSDTTQDEGVQCRPQTATLEALNGDERLSQAVTITENWTGRSQANIEQEGEPVMMDSSEDPRLWAGVLDSIAIDMDRHWVEAALLGENGVVEDQRH
ncbi:unnamed protein product [Clonostachys rhizophaga]|uniref:Zn(2)-C6 fungal-type domain-containing protein n=1 Tax=Clonostachys rhizophaga TaxID=160324 RepID=A0A9N9VW99_9HYPO|nr:unnamed protein product [Clonostachys rhizophaga]